MTRTVISESRGRSAMTVNSRVPAFRRVDSRNGGPRSDERDVINGGYRVVCIRSCYEEVTPRDADCCFSDEAVVERAKYGLEETQKA